MNDWLQMHSQAVRAAAAAAAAPAAEQEERKQQPHSQLMQPTHTTLKQQQSRWMQRQPQPHVTAAPPAPRLPRLHVVGPCLFSSVASGATAADAAAEEEQQLPTKRTMSSEPTVAEVLSVQLSGLHKLVFQLGAKVEAVQAGRADEQAQLHNLSTMVQMGSTHHTALQENVAARFGQLDDKIDLQFAAADDKACGQDARLERLEKRQEEQEATRQQDKEAMQCQIDELVHKHEEQQQLISALQEQVQQRYAGRTALGVPIDG